MVDFVVITRWSFHFWFSGNLIRVYYTSKVRHPQSQPILLWKTMLLCLKSDLLLMSCPPKSQCKIRSAMQMNSPYLSRGDQFLQETLCSLLNIGFSKILSKCWCFSLSFILLSKFWLAFLLLPLINICKVLFLSCINIQYSVMCWLSPIISQKKFACANILEMLRGYASYFLQEGDVWEVS